MLSIRAIRLQDLYKLNDVDFESEKELYKVINNIIQDRYKEIHAKHAKI